MLRTFLKILHLLYFFMLLPSWQVIASNCDQKQVTATYCANSYIKEKFREQCITKFTKRSEEGCSSQRLLLIPGNLWKNVFLWAGEFAKKWRLQRSINFQSKITCITKLTDYTCAVACNKGTYDMNDKDHTEVYNIMPAMIYVCDIMKGKVLYTLRENSEGIRSLAALPNDILASVSVCDQKIKLWNTLQGVYLRILVGHSDSVSTLAALPNGKLASGSDNYIIKIWDPLTGACLHTLNGDERSIRSLTVFPKDNRLVIGFNHIIQTWCLLQNERISTSIINTDKTRWHLRAAALPHENLAVGFNDGTINICHTNSGSCVSTFKAHDHMISSLATLKNGFLASGSAEATIKIWNPLTHECLCILQGHTQAITSLAVMSYDTLISGSDDKTLKVWRNPRDFGVNVEKDNEWVLISSSASSSSTTCSS